MTLPVGAQGQVSPEATGGAGTVEEYRLDAVALARLLTGDVFPGLSSAVTRVELQRSAAGHALDDLVLHSGTPAGEIGIDYQAKRTMAPVPSDKSFKDALAQCLATMEDQADALAAGSLRWDWQRPASSTSSSSYES